MQHQAQQLVAQIAYFSSTGAPRNEVATVTHVNVTPMNRRPATENVRAIKRAPATGHKPQALKKAGGGNSGTWNEF
jgi:hypothetical protein